MISCIHPSRSRVLQALATAKAWIGRANNPPEYILSLDEDDKSLNDYKMAFRGMNVRIIVGKNRSAIDAINKAAEVSKGDILVVVSDDFDCPVNWDRDLFKHTQDKTDWIAKTDDTVQYWLITLPIMDRVYYNRFGYIYHPDYLHLFVDTHMTCVADLLGCKIEIPMTFEHRHYSLGRTDSFKKDEISVKADNTWSQGERLFLHFAKNNFGLPADSIKGKIKSDDYISWMKGKGVRL